MQSNVPVTKDTKIKIRQVFNKTGHPYDNIPWERRNAVIVGADGKEKFRQDNVEVPAWWDDNQTQVVADKYLRIVNGEKETSTKQMFSRVARWITAQGVKQGVFTAEEGAKFELELLYLLANGMYAFNSPVWFNVGVKEQPQCSACFINAVEDTMESIVDLAQKEVMLFKGGSGTGSNLSPLRSSYEKLSKGGRPSGPVSFMKGYDAFAGVTKSGGGTRRAAKMVVLNVDHPDILETADGTPGFIKCKSDAEETAHALFSTGKYTAEFNKPGNVYDRVGYQNANNSVRVVDEFMERVLQNGEWVTREVQPPNKPVKTYQAQQLWEEIAKAAHFCGDPGIQFDTATNAMHTCPNSGRINASNPCQPSWATVLTKEGIRTFADVEVGTEIWSGKQWTKIVRKVATGIKPVYRFYTRAGVFVGTEEHRVLSKGVRVEVQDAETIDTVQGPFPGCVPLDHQTVVDGLMFGDGYVKVSNDGRDHYSLLCIGENDQSYFSDPEIAEFLNKQPFDKLAHRCKTTLGREELPKTYLRAIPDRFLGGDEVQVASFLRGLYSANGSVVGQRITLKASSFAVISQVQEMLSSVGIRSYYTTNRSTDVEFQNGNYTSRESYDLNISTDRALFAQMIGFIQPYKQKKLNEILGTSFSGRDPKSSYEVVEKQLVREEPVWDIEVAAEEHTYWTGGLLVSNCSEYLFLDDTACNLGSLNLLKFTDGAKGFKLAEFEHACEITIIAKEIIVDASSYPSKQITENSHKYRTLGLGYTNVGALLTYWGLSYDSHEARTVIGAITAVMTAAAYKSSAELARVQGPFPEYEKNKDAMLDVIRKHWDAAKRLPSLMVKERQLIVDRAFEVWNEAFNLGCKWGFRNAQTTVIAPTGTISFVMGADTTGVEPMLSVVVYKKLVGEGLLILVNGVVEKALRNLGYSQETLLGILEYIQNKKTIHGAPGFDPKHGVIFSEALGEHALRPEAHVDMMVAIQPFISGGISKTVNMPSNATVKEVSDIYMRAWRGRLKCVAIYRDGCKLSQPIGTSLTDRSNGKTIEWGQRKRLTKTRNSITHKFSIGQIEGYLIAGLYPDGTLGELFVEIAKQGSTLMGLVDCWVQAVSIGLQHGIPFEVLRDKYVDMKFEPAGITEDAEIRFAKSLPDFVFRWLDLNIVNKKKAEDSSEKIELPVRSRTKSAEILKTDIPKSFFEGPPCTSCGNLTQRSGSCYVCSQCGTTSGCS